MSKFWSSVNRNRLRAAYYYFTLNRVDMKSCDSLKEGWWSADDIQQLCYIHYVMIKLLWGWYFIITFDVAFNGYVVLNKQLMKNVFSRKYTHEIIFTLYRMVWSSLTRCINECKYVGIVTKLKSTINDVIPLTCHPTGGLVDNTSQA